jgi:hypothetical protein
MFWAIVTKRRHDEFSFLQVFNLVAMTKIQNEMAEGQARETRQERISIMINMRNGPCASSCTVPVG